MAWCLEGLRAYLKEGLNPPAIVIAATDEYLAGEDTLGAWIVECCEMNLNGKASSAALWSSWKEWAERNGEVIGTRRRFSQSIGDREGVKGGFIGSSKRGFFGIQLKPDLI